MNHIWATKQALTIAENVEAKHQISVILQVGRVQKAAIMNHTQVVKQALTIAKNVEAKHQISVILQVGCVQKAAIMNHWNSFFFDS